MSRRAKITAENILQAAAELADTKGIQEITVAALADALEIAAPSLYNHIEGLQELRRKLAVYSMEQLYQHLIESTIGKAGDDAVRALGDAYLAFVRVHPGLYEATFFYLDERDPEIDKAAGKVVELVIRILAAYGFEEEEALHVTRGLRSILHGFSSLEHKGGFGLPLDIDVSYRLLIDTYLTGLHANKKKRV